MRIITVSREYGSGGRELAEKLAEKLDFKYYDKNIITEIALKTNLDEAFVGNNLEKSAKAFPSHLGRGSYYSPILSQGAIKVAVAQREILRSLANSGDAVFVGRAADIILSDFAPLNFFVYSDMASRIARCRKVVPEFEGLTDRQAEKNILRVDKERAKCREMLSETKWGDRSCYHLMISTSGLNIADIVPALADYALEWFNGKTDTTF